MAFATKCLATAQAQSESCSDHLTAAALAYNTEYFRTSQDPSKSTFPKAPTNALMLKQPIDKSAPNKNFKRPLGGNDGGGGGSGSRSNSSSSCLIAAASSSLAFSTSASPPPAAAPTEDDSVKKARKADKARVRRERAQSLAQGAVRGSVALQVIPETLTFAGVPQLSGEKAGAFLASMHEHLDETIAVGSNDKQIRCPKPQQIFAEIYIYIPTRSQVKAHEEKKETKSKRRAVHRHLSNGDEIKGYLLMGRTNE